MGLCKCPKRKVTSLFCREHNVNVCEHCMADSHKQCVIKSFSDWLSDSDIESNCLLCHNSLKDAECVRLQCLDVFHTSCLADYGFSYPPHTAPAGYRCSTCKAGIIPEHNVSSIIAVQLREFLATVNWGRPALGLAPIPECDRKAPIQLVPATAVYEVPAQHNHVHVDMNGSVQYAAPLNTQGLLDHVVPPAPRSYAPPPPPSMMDTALTARRKQDLDMEPLLGRHEEENKYERRTHAKGSSFLKCGKKRILIYVVGALFTFIVFMFAFHGNKDSDPLLNPEMDPNMGHVAPDS